MSFALACSNPGNHEVYGKEWKTTGVKFRETQGGRTFPDEDCGADTADTR